jgi:hypothetical protein
MNTRTVLGTQYPLTLVEVPGRGRCLVSAGHIPTRAIIEVAPVQVLPTPLARIVETFKLDYMVKWIMIDGSSTLAMPLGLFGLCNHSDDPSAELSIDYAGRLVRLIARHPLEDGDEITITYRDPGRSYSP